MAQEKTIIDHQTSVEKMLIKGAESKQPTLMVLHGGQLKGPYAVDRAQMFIGRDAACDIVLTDTKASRKHSQLIYDNLGDNDRGDLPRVRLKDLGSTNGTFVNGIEISEVELRDHDKIMIGSTLFGYFLRDESTLKAEQRLVELATSDALTGLRNRVVFDMEIQREFAMARRHSRPLSLLLFDIDHFKRVNDTYGHPTGDAVLREIGVIIAGTSRVNDLTARYGGEEFAIILPETPIENALVHAERMRKRVEDYPFKTVEGEPVKVTISIGVSGMTDTSSSPADLIKTADEALYAAKQAGRNRVVRAQSTHSPGGPSSKTPADAFETNP